MVRYRIIFSGLVQGVGFRYFVSRTARQHGLTGFVQNLDDGRVQTEVQGHDEQIAEFLKTVCIGNGYAMVRDYAMENLAVHLSEHTFIIE